METESNSIAREEYEAPIIEDIPMRANETLLAGCKAVGGTGPGSSAGGGFHSCSACRNPSAS